MQYKIIKSSLYKTPARRNIVLVSMNMHGVSNHSNDILKTTLGSCVGICIYDAKAIAGGILHIRLSYSKRFDNLKYKNIPTTYADTGIPILIKDLEALGCARINMRATLFGGAKIHPGLHEIGLANLAAAEEVLNRMGIVVYQGDTGGNKSRTVSLDIANGSYECQFYDGTPTLQKDRYSPKTLFQMPALSKNGRNPWQIQQMEALGLKLH
ncbi:MAG: chemotaxis protein CheD [Candidatus Margulisiibacteriota bacterium]